MPANFAANAQLVVVDLDGANSQVSGSLQQYLAAAVAGQTPAAPLPSIVWVTDAFSVAHATSKVSADQGVWGAIVVGPGTTSALELAVATASNASSSTAAVAAVLQPLASALTFVWDEGRSPTIAPRVGSGGRTLLLKFVQLFAAGFVQQLAATESAAALSVIAGQAPSLLASPIGFVEVNLHPAAALPTATPALTVGLVLTLVISVAACKAAKMLLPDPAFVIDSAAAARASGSGVWARMDGLWSPVLPPSLVMARAAVHLGGASGLAIFSAILFAGISNESSAWRAGAAGGAAFCGVVLLLSLSVVFYMAACYELGGDQFITLLFLPVAYYNALAGWNLDLAAPGYQFFQYAPVYHAARLARHVIYPATGAAAADVTTGPLGASSQVGASVAALVVWSVLGFGFYVLVALVVRPHALAALQARWAGAQRLAAVSEEEADVVAKAPLAAVLDARNKA